jgi:spermidine/putrescine transport system permease protein
MKKILASSYLGILLLLLYAPILIIILFSFTEAKVLETGLIFIKLYTPFFMRSATFACNALWILFNRINCCFGSTLLGTMAATVFLT